MIPSIWLIAFAAITFGLGLFFLSIGLKNRSGLPYGRVLMSDTGRRRELDRPLYSKSLALTGRPDYLIEQPNGDLIPVEFKSSRTPAVPHPGHILQLAAYCALVEAQLGKRPPFGILRYSDKSFEVDYTPQLESELQNALDQMRIGFEHAAPNRSHRSTAKCSACGVAHACDQKLA